MTFDLPDLPKTSTDPTVKEFLAKYYGISNQAESHDDYTDLFSFDREFAMNDKSAKGRQRRPYFSPRPESKPIRKPHPTCHREFD
jgi:hypothetical protein